MQQKRGEGEGGIIWEKNNRSCAVVPTVGRKIKNYDFCKIWIPSFID